MRVRPGVVLALLVLGGGSAGLSAERLPFQGAALEQFLQLADVSRMRPIGRGVTLPRRVTLVLGTEQHDAAWKTIDEARPGLKSGTRGRPEVDFEDTYRAECAAYELDLLLKLGMVPATIERVIGGERGSLTLWIERTMPEAERYEKRILPPDTDSWSKQLDKVRLFDNLIYNTDRNLHNLLITADWQIRLIDHSRAFRKTPELRAPDGLIRFSQALLSALKRLDEPTLKGRLGRFLTIWQIRAILERRDLIVDRAARLASERGEAVVYYP